MQGYARSPVLDAVGTEAAAVRAGYSALELGQPPEHGGVDAGDAVKAHAAGAVDALGGLGHILEEQSATCGTNIRESTNKRTP